MLLAKLLLGAIKEKHVIHVLVHYRVKSAFKRANY